MAKQSIFFDTNKCIGCYACVIACKLKHHAPPHPALPPEGNPRGINLITLYHEGPVMRDDRVFQFFQPLSCLHCTDAACLTACEEGAIYRDPVTGAVLVDQERCTGCAACLPACPYGIPQFADDGKMIKCDMCVDRLRAGKQAACEATCVARAISVGRDGEITEIK